EPAVDYELISANKQLKKLSHEEINQLLDKAHQELSSLSDWTPETIQNCLNLLLEQTGSKPGTLFSLVRVVTTWSPFSPEIDKTLALLGRDRTLERIKAAH